MICKMKGSAMQVTMEPCYIEPMSAPKGREHCCRVLTTKPNSANGMRHENEMSRYKQRGSEEKKGVERGGGCCGRL